MSDEKRKCSAYINYCNECGERFAKDSTSCKNCGTERPRCKNWAKKNGKCKDHGGNAPSGISHYSNKLSIYSNSLPARYQRAYLESIESKDIVETSPEIALLQARNSELIKGADAGESGKLYEDIKDAWEKYKRSFRISDKREREKKMQEAWLVLEDLIEVGYGDAVAWKEIRANTDSINKLKQQELRRREKAGKMMSMYQVKRIVGLMVNIINQNITDPKVRYNILKQFETIVLDD